MKSKHIFYYFSKNERIGIVFLISILLILLFSPKAYEHFIGDAPTFHWESIVVGDSTFKNISIDERNFSKDSSLILSLQSFSESQWLQAGVSRLAVKSLQSYLAKGRKITSLLQLKMTYGITSEDFAIIQKQLAKQELSAFMEKDNFLATKHNLNTIDSFSLMQFPGIGPFFAKMIVEHRNRLGGYYSLDQLKEVYKITPELVEKIKPYLYCDVSAIQKININEATYFSLLKHPYFSKEKAKKILERISRKGKFQSLLELKNENIFTSEELDKIEHYLIF